MEKPQTMTEKERPINLWDRRREIYYHALPFHTGRMDLARMPFPETSGPAAFLEDLLEKGAFEAQLPPLGEPGPPFAYWYQELRNTKRLSGHHSLALGFPLLFLPAGSSLRVVPVYLFDLMLEPDAGEPGRWRLSHSADQRVRINPWLESYLRAEEGLPAPAPLAALVKERPIRAAVLRERLQLLTEQSGWRPLPEAPELQPCPDIDRLDQLEGRGAIYWCGVIGCFPPGPPAVQAAVDVSFPEASFLAPEGHAVAHSALDPYQMTAFQAARRRRLTVIDGAAGTGKSFVVWQFLLNALSNGKKCLVVAPSLETLRAARRRMDQLQLGALVFSAADVRRDTRLLLELLRSAGEAAPPSPSFSADRFQQALHKWERQKGKLDETYRALRRPVFGKYAWAETVGLYLESSRLEGKELLTAQLTIQDFRFGYEEYVQLLEAVRQCQSLYRRVNTLRHPLQNLHNQVFLENSSEEARAFVYEQLDIFTRKLFHLQKRYIDKVNEYADLLSEYLEQRYDELHGRLRSLQEQIADAVAEYGRDFELNSMISLRLYGSFLTRFRERLEAKKSIFANYHALAAAFQKAPLFDFEFAAAEEGRALPRMRESLKAFSGKLSAWREKLPDLIQESLSRLSSKTVHPGLPFRGHVIELEDALDLRLAELNRSQLYAEPFENRMLTIPRRRKYLEEVIEQLENTKLYMREFDALYDWRRFWLGLSGAGRKLIQALIKVRPQNWEAAFKSWYLYHCLQQCHQHGLPASEISLRQFVFNNEQVQSMLPAQISHYWWGRRQEMLREWRRSDRKRYQQLFTRKNETERAVSLDEIFEEHGAMITDLLPVWMVTPPVARALIRQESCFDCIVVEESHLAPASELTAELLAHESIVVTGNREWEAQGPGHSVFSLARAKADEVCRLPYLHRWSPGDALGLRRPDYLVQNAITGFSVRFEQVDGRYDEQSGANEAEAREIVRLLNEVEKTPQRTYPSIAIATLTTGQRDLIASYLRDIKQRQLPGVEILHQLERNGLGVFQIDELAGQHPDILFLSVTYGPVDIDGTTTDHLLELNRPEGLARLSLLMTRPRKAVFIVNSLPGEVIEKNMENPGRPGTFLLANYLKYIYALKIADAAQQQLVVQNLATHFPGSDLPRPNTRFIREVASSLQSYIAKERIHAQTMDAHLYLPLKVDPASVDAGPVIVIPDGFFSPTPETDFRWEFDQHELYRQQGYQPVPAWSVSWWKNAAAEARDLAEKIEKKSTEGIS